MTTRTVFVFESAHSSRRIPMIVTEEDLERFMSLPRNSDDAVEVFDHVVGHAVIVKRGDCGQLCRCAAVIVARHSQPVGNQ